MDEYYTKYAKPIQKTTISEVKLNLLKWKNNLKDEQDGLLYLKQKFSSGAIKVETSLMNKITDVITKLDLLIEKEIENIAGFINVLERKGNDVLDDKTYTKLELIRDNYNKILLNIHKMLTTNPDLTNGTNRNNKVSTAKVSNALMTKKETKQINSNTNNAEDYQIDKEIKAIQQNFVKVKGNSDIPQTQKQMQMQKEREKAQNLSRINKNPRTEDTSFHNTNTKRTKGFTDKSLVKANTNTEHLPSFHNIQTEIEIIKEYLSKLESKLLIVENLEYDKSYISKMKEEHLKIETEMRLMTKDIDELTDTLGAYEKRIYLLEDSNSRLIKKNQILNEVIEVNIPGFNIDSYVLNREKALSAKDKFSSTIAPHSNKPRERKLISSGNGNKSEDKGGLLSNHSNFNNNKQYYNKEDIMSNDRFFTNSFYDNDDFHNKSSVEVQKALKATNSSNNIKKERFLIPRK